MREYQRKPYFSEDYFTLKMFNPVGVEWFEANKPYYDDEYLSSLDYQSYQFQTTPFFELVNQSIQDPYIDDFIQPLTDPFTKKGSDKTGVLGKIGFDDDFKKTDESGDETEDPVTGNPILEVEAQKTADFELIDNNKSHDKYSWIVKESGTVDPRRGAYVTFTAPDRVPANEEPVKLYLFSEQNQLDYVKIEIISSTPYLVVRIEKEGYASYSLVWDIANESLYVEIERYTGGGETAIYEETTSLVGSDLFEIEQSSIYATQIDCDLVESTTGTGCGSEGSCEYGIIYPEDGAPCSCESTNPSCLGVQCECSATGDGSCADSVVLESSCPGVNGEKLNNVWSVSKEMRHESWAVYECKSGPYFWAFRRIDSDFYYLEIRRKELTIQNSNYGFNSYILTALNDSEYVGSARTIYNKIDEYDSSSGTTYTYALTVETPLGQLLYSEKYGSSGDTGTVKAQFGDNCISQGYILQYADSNQKRIVKVLAQANTVSNGETQMPTEMGRTSGLETVVEELINTWYSGNKFDDETIENLNITWELRG